MKNGKKKFHYPIKSYLLYLILINFMFIDIAFSKFITTKTTDSTNQVAKFGELEILENGQQYDQAKTWIVAPGIDIIKDAVIHFSSSDVDCYLFLELDLSGFEWIDGTFQCQKNDETYLSWNLAEDWTSLQIENKYVYYQKVKANQTISAPVIANQGKISVSSKIKASDLNEITHSLAIKIQVDVVQAGGFDDVYDAYNTLKK